MVSDRHRHRRVSHAICFVAFSERILDEALFQAQLGRFDRVSRDAKVRGSPGNRDFEETVS